MSRDHLAKRVSAKAALPARSPAPIDLTHLARMTLGDRRLQQEILDLFDQQIGLLMARMNGADVASIGALAHTLKGSARSIGARDLAGAAAAIEAAAGGRALVLALAAVEAEGARVRESISQMRQNEADREPAL